VRLGARYERSLEMLGYAKKISPGTPVKSGLMLGLGETLDEVRTVMHDLRAHSVDILTLGQYLRPSPRHLPIVRYIPPSDFDELRPTLDSLKSSAGQLVPTMTSLITFGQLFDRAAPGDYLNVDATIEFLLDAPAQRPPLPANSSASNQSSTNSYAQASTNSGSVSQLLTGGLR